MSQAQQDVQEYNIVIAGMGGQGSILASYMVAEAAVIDGLDVLSTGDYGMAQRGGMVTTHLRLGKRPQAQKIPVGCGDLMIGCAPSEALRNISALHENALIILDTLVHVPIPVYIDNELTYPSFEEISSKFHEHFERVYSIEASRLAAEFGNPRVMNTILLGASFASGTIPISRGAMIRALENQMKGDLVALNIKAFERGEEEMIKLL